MSGKQMNEGDTLAEVREGLEMWRKGGKKGGRIPEELWLMATQIAEHRGCHRTARELRLNKTALKERMERSKKQPQPQFVQIGGGVSAESAKPRCTVEIENQVGARLLFHLEGVGVGDVAARLVQEFVGVRR
jgi:hypothetical protein